MADWLRRAGHGRAPDGSLVTWSVAEGSRGRRWREVVVAGEGIRSSLLLELDPRGRFSHLELSTPAGLLTLHPEGDGTLHGNAATGDGVRHVIGLPWQAGDVVRVEGSTVCTVAAPGATGVTIALDLVTRRDAALAGGPATDTDGLPVLVDGRSWPLEQDA